MNRLKQLLSAALVAALLALPTAAAFGQSSPGLIYGQVPTAAQWNSYFAAKQDVLGYTPLNRAGGTMTGPLNTAASTASSAGLNIPQGIAPIAPVNGDVWTTASGVFFRINGSTIGPIGPASGTVSSVATGAGLTGGPITSTGTISLAAIAADNILANPTGSSAAPIATPLVSCSTAASALIYNTTTHAFGCNTISGSGTVNSGTAGQVAYYPGTSDAVSGNPNLTISGGVVTFGVAGSAVGRTVLSGSTSGSITLQGQAVSGTPTVTFGTSSGTPAVTASSPLSIAATTGNITCPTCGVTSAGLNQFASTTSSQLAGVISDETGSGFLVFGTSPTIASPTLSGTVAGANTIPLSILKTQAADTIVMNASASVASPTAVALLSCSTANSALTYSTGSHSFGCNALSTIITVPLNTPNGNQGVWLLSNATYDAGTDQFSCVDNTKYAYGLNMRTATLPFEPIADSGIAFWRTTCSTTPIGGYATIGGWEAQIISDQFRNMVVGGMGLEVDGSGILPYSRLVNSLNLGNNYRAIMSNAYADLSGVDTTTDPSWLAGFVNDSYSICRAPATGIQTAPTFACFVGLTNAGVLSVGGSQVALLNTADQVLTGGANVTPFSLGTVSSGTTTIDCGKSPLQNMLNTGASTIAAPVLDGSCIVQVVNGVSAGAITLSGFSAAPSSGATFAQAPTLSATVTISNASPGVVTWTAHGLVANTQVYFTTSGGLPAPLVAGTIYYVVGSSIAANTFTVSATANGAAINTTTAGSGTHTGVKPSVFALNVLRVNGQASPSWFQQQ